MDANTLECPDCGSSLIREERVDVCTYKSQEVSYKQPGWWCGDCDEAILQGDDNIVSNTVFVELRARVEGVLSPSQIKTIRKRLKLTQRQASEMFGGGRNAFQKYESGEVVPSVGMSLLLQLIGDHAEHLQSLSVMRERFYNMPLELPEMGLRVQHGNVG